MSVKRNLIIYTLSLVAVIAAPQEKKCDKTLCKGPLKYYEEIACRPVYKKNGDCCPYKYNCENLNNRSKDRCIINGHLYELGESLRPEDGQPCDIGCVCQSNEGVFGFECAVMDCPFDEFKEGCYQPRNATECCEGEPVCSENKAEWPTCTVDGKTYKAGEYFSPKGEPKKDCYCGAGYTGENIPPFCTPAPISKCAIELRHAYEIHNKCVPVFRAEQSSITDCPRDWRCQNDRDQIVKRKNKSAEGKSSSSESDSSESSEEKSKADDEICKFGNLTMRIGDELNDKTNYDSVCVKCVCEIPPTPSCVKLPSAVCDVTNHPSFNTTAN